MSLIERALKQLKLPQREIAPLGRLHDGRDSSTAEGNLVEDPSGERLVEGAKHAVSSGFRSGAQPSAPREGRLVTIDRDRLREEGFLAPEKYERQMADEYRRIKRPLISNAFGLGLPKLELGNLILISSAIPGEGKTHTCLNLALSLSAERDRTVLLVDGDVPNPHISRLLGIADQPGLLDVLGDHPPNLEELLIRTDVPRLSVLPAGTLTGHAPELLASTRMAELCSELSQRYPDRTILFDSPPLLAATEGQAIAMHVGQVVLVIAESATGRDEVRAAFGLLDHRKPINAILNKSRRSKLGGYYQSSYGYGARVDVDQQGSTDAQK